MHERNFRSSGRPRISSMLRPSMRLASRVQAGAAGSKRRGELRSIGPLAAFHLPELRHHLAACLGEVCRDGLALRLRAKPGSPLAIGRDPEIADKTGVGRGHGRSLGPTVATAAHRHKFRMLISRAGRSGSFRYSRWGASTSSIHFMNARTRRDRLLRCATTRDTAIARRRKSGMISTSAPLSKYWPIPKSGA